MGTLFKNFYVGISNWFNSKQNVKQLRLDIDELKILQNKEQDKIMEMLLMISSNTNNATYNSKDTKELKTRVRTIENEVIANGKMLVRIETKLEDIK